MCGLKPPETVVVVGGGISAGQVALRLLGDGHQVHLVSRHAFREHQFDSDPGWLGPKYMAAFEREPDVARRRQIISEARHKGSVPPDVLSGLKRAMRKRRDGVAPGSGGESGNDGSVVGYRTEHRRDLDASSIAHGHRIHHPTTGWTARG